MEAVTRVTNAACDKNQDSDAMQCIHNPHSHRTNPSGSGICAFCLQDKLAKLVSSSFPPPSPSSPSSSLSLSLQTHHKPNKTSTSTSTSSANIIFKRTKSITTSKNSFWSFLYPSSVSKPKYSTPSKNPDHVIITQEEKCVASSSSSLVSRSRSVGCGSRSFSGERISSALGDCTLRRVESQREGKPCVNVKERVRCGGIFGGFVMASSSSSSSSTSSSWVCSSVDERKSWGWALPSPMRAFGTKGSNNSKTNHKNATPNLSAIPSLLTVKA